MLRSLLTPIPALAVPAIPKVAPKMAADSRGVAITRLKRVMAGPSGEASSVSGRAPAMESTLVHGGSPVCRAIR